MQLDIERDRGVWMRHAANRQGESRVNLLLVAARIRAARRQEVLGDRISARAAEAVAERQAELVGLNRGAPVDRAGGQVPREQETGLHRAERHALYVEQRLAPCSVHIQADADEVERKIEGGNR